MASLAGIDLQVGAGVKLNATSGANRRPRSTIDEGIILSQTAITLQTTATMHGRALAQSLIAIDNNTVTAP